VSLLRDDGTVHHHGLLAGLGAGAVAVLCATGLVLIDWHRAAGPVTLAITVVACVVAATAAAAAVLALMYAVLWLRHKSRHFTAAIPPAPPAEMLGSAGPELPAPAPRAELPAAHTHVHLPEGMDPEQVAAVLRGMHPAQLSPGVPELER